MFFTTAATAQGKSTVILESPNQKSSSSNKWYYCTAATQAGLTAVTHGSAITVASWTELTAASQEITPTSGHKYIRVIECVPDSTDYKPISVGDGILNIGT